MSTDADTTSPVTTEEPPVLPPLPEVPKEDHDHDHEVGTECVGGCAQVVKP